MTRPQPSIERRPGSIRERRLTFPETVWGPLALGSLLGIVGLAGLATGQPWLFPSLGPTAYLIAEQPEQSSARVWNTVVGHLVGLATGILAVTLLGVGTAPSPMSTGRLAPVRVGASVVAALATLPILNLLRASHPPAAATMLLITLGGLPPTSHTALTVLAGSATLAIMGAGFRNLKRTS